MTFLFALLLSTIGPVHAKVPTAEFLQNQIQQSEPLDVIVYFHQKASLEPARLILSRTERHKYVRQQLIAVAEKSQQQLVQLAQEKGWNYRAFYIENAMQISGVSPQDLQLLQTMDSQLRYIGANAKAELKTMPPTLSQSAQRVIEPLKMIKADKVWRELGTTGEGIVVAGQDTGYFWQHNSLIEQYRGYNSGNVSHDYHWHDAIHSGSNRCGVSATAPCDDKGHGTHTMGTIVGSSADGRAIGVAPGAQWMGCRNMNVGVGTVATYLECFEFFMAPYPNGGDPRTDGETGYAPHIINNSWSCPSSEGCRGGEFLDAIRALKEAGIATVVAASNNGPGCGTIADPPGMYAGEVLSVGAYNRYQRKIAFFSSLGPSAWNGVLAPNLIAPGSAVYSAGHQGRSSYTDKSGTSMSSPMVAGVLALLWSHRPELVGEIDESFAILMRTSDPITSSTRCGSFDGRDVPNAVYGWGMVNAYRALTE